MRTRGRTESVRGKMFRRVGESFFPCRKRESPGLKTIRELKIHRLWQTEAPNPKLPRLRGENSGEHDFHVDVLEIENDKVSGRDAAPGIANPPLARP